MAEKEIPAWPSQCSQSDLLNGWMVQSILSALDKRTNLPIQQSDLSCVSAYVVAHGKPVTKKAKQKVKVFMMI